MSDKDFLRSKVELLGKDKQSFFDGLAAPLSDMIKQGEHDRKIQIPADGNWFRISFDAIEARKDRLVISARRVVDGLVPVLGGGGAMEYVVEFEGTRAAYLRGYYFASHRIGGWPYITWDIRSYTTLSSMPGCRIYVQNFRANDEIRRLILAMEAKYHTKNIVNSYINDNLSRFQAGIRANKTSQQIEKEKFGSMMENLGYRHVEAHDKGYPQGSWKELAVHWCKLEQDLCGGRL